MSKKIVTKADLRQVINEQKETIAKLEKQIKEQNDELNEFKYRLLITSTNCLSTMKMFNPEVWPSQKYGWGNFPFKPIL